MRHVNDTFCRYDASVVTELVERYDAALPGPDGLDVDTERVRREVMAVVKRWDMGPEQAAAVIAAVNRGLALPGPDGLDGLDGLDEIATAAQRNDMGRVIALALSSQGYAQTDSEAVGLALLREIEEQGYTMRLTTDAERTAKNALPATPDAGKGET